MISNYKELIFWQKSYQVTKDIISLCKKLPKDTISYILISQVVRSASSVGANIAEGFGRYKTKEYERFLQIALGSANETEYWLLIMKDTYPSLGKEIDNIMEINLETTKMLARSLQTLKSKRTGV